MSPGLPEFKKNKTKKTKHCSVVFGVHYIHVPHKWTCYKIKTLLFNEIYTFRNTIQTWQ